jgi:hypothetical protein
VWDCFWRLSLFKFFLCYRGCRLRALPPSLKLRRQVGTTAGRLATKQQLSRSLAPQAAYGAESARDMVRLDGKTLFF